MFVSYTVERLPQSLFCFQAKQGKIGKARKGGGGGEKEMAQMAEKDRNEGN